MKNEKLVIIQSFYEQLGDHLDSELNDSFVLLKEGTDPSIKILLEPFRKVMGHETISLAISQIEDIIEDIQGVYISGDTNEKELIIKALIKAPESINKRISITPTKLGGHQHNEELEKLAKLLIGLTGIQGCFGHNQYFVSVSNQLINDKGELEPIEGEDYQYAMLATYTDKGEAIAFAKSIDLSPDKGSAAYVLVESLQGHFYEAQVTMKTDYTIVSKYE